MKKAKKAKKATKAIKSTKASKSAKKSKSMGKKLVKKTKSKKAVSKSKTKKVSFIPKGYNYITPYLIIDDARSAIEFYKKVFGAKEKMRMENNGRIAHAEMQIGDTRIMLADESPEMNAYSPQKMGGSPVIIHLYIKNVDETVDRALSLGANLKRPAQDMFYGDRSASIEDPYGHTWSLATHIEDVTPAKVKKRAAEVFGNME